MSVRVQSPLSPFDDAAAAPFVYGVAPIWTNSTLAAGNALLHLSHSSMRRNGEQVTGDARLPQKFTFICKRQQP